MRRRGLFLLTAAVGALSAAPWAIVCTQAPKKAASGEGRRIVLVKPDGAARNLTEGFASAADPAVSFDGKQILFAAKKSPADAWNIYEMTADGADVREITHDLGNCRSPIYQSSIFYLEDPGPMAQIAFTSDVDAERGEWGAAGVTALYSARLDGSGVRRLTYNPSGALQPAMLPDGRMVFPAGRTRVAGAAPRIDLFGINIDGTDFAAFSGDQGFRMKRMPCVTAKREVIFVDSDTMSPDGSGPLTAIDLRRNLHSLRRITRPEDGAFLSPAPLPDGTVLVARRQGGSYGIWRLDPATRKLDPVFDTPEFDELQPQAVEARALPDGRSSVVDEKVGWAKLYCLNVYESDLDRAQWKAGLVKRIRILEGRPHLTADTLSPLLVKRFIGEFDIDADGSFQAQIPANVPVQLQALDANGMALRTSAWIWTKNKEQRGCIGCHEDGERTPENLMAQALTHPAVNLVLAPERRRTVEFERDVMPIIQTRCASATCHGGAALPKLAGKAARFNAAYEALLAKDEKGGHRLVVPGSARTSPLIWTLAGRDTSRPWDRKTAPATIKRMPPQSSAPLTAEQMRAIVEWIDLGAHWSSAVQERK